MYVGWKCFPHNKGLVTSLIFAANGLGTILATILSTIIVNPNDLQPTIYVTEGVITYRYFYAEVSQNVPKFLQVFSLAETLILIYGIFHIYIPADSEEPNTRMINKCSSQPLCEKLKIAVKSKQFALSYMIMFLGVFYF